MLSPVVLHDGRGGCTCPKINTMFLVGIISRIRQYEDIEIICGAQCPLSATTKWSSESFMKNDRCREMNLMLCTGSLVPMSKSQRLRRPGTRIEEDLQSMPNVLVQLAYPWPICLKHLYPLPVKYLLVPRPDCRSRKRPAGLRQGSRSHVGLLTIDHVVQRMCYSAKLVGEGRRSQAVASTSFPSEYL